MAFFGIIPIVVVLLVLLKVLFGPERRNKFWGSFGLVIALVVLCLSALRMHRDFGGGPRIVRMEQIPPNLIGSQQALQQRGIRSMTIPATQTGNDWSLRTFSDATDAPTTQISQLWVDDWQAYLNSTNFRGFRAESSDVSVTELESRGQAIHHASEVLMQSLAGDSRIRQLMRNTSANREMIRQQIEFAIQSGSVIVSQCVRTTEKSYGTLWKTYLLIDTSPAKLDPLVRQLTQQLAVHRKEKLTAAASIGATMLVVLLLYAFLNTVTKGYFIWRLRAGVILVLIAGVLIFFANV